MSNTTYRRVQHAAHYAYNHPAKGHDLEQWDVVGGERPNKSKDVPANAEFHSGYRDASGVQHWLFVRIAPLTGTCPRCK